MRSRNHGFFNFYKFLFPSYCLTAAGIIYLIEISPHFSFQFFLLGFPFLVLGTASLLIFIVTKELSRSVSLKSLTTSNSKNPNYGVLKNLLLFQGPRCDSDIILELIEAEKTLEIEKFAERYCLDNNSSIHKVIKNFQTQTYKID